MATTQMKTKLKIKHVLWMMFGMFLVISVHVVTQLMFPPKEKHINAPCQPSTPTKPTYPLVGNFKTYGAINASCVEINKCLIPRKKVGKKNSGVKN